VPELLQWSRPLQASDVIPVVAVMNGLLFGSEGERHPQANVRVNKVNSGAITPTILKGPAADAQFSAKGRFVSGVQLPPKPVAEDDLLIGADFAFPLA